METMKTLDGDLPYLKFPPQLSFHEKRQVSKEVSKALWARLKYLYTIILHYTMSDQTALAVSTGRQFLDTVKMEGVMLPDSIQTHFCSHCSAFLLPTFSSSARMEREKKKTYVVIECRLCKKAMSKEVAFTRKEKSKQGKGELALASPDIKSSSFSMTPRSLSGQQNNHFVKTQLSPPAPSSYSTHPAITPTISKQTKMHPNTTGKVSAKELAVQPPKFSFLSSMSSSSTSRHTGLAAPFAMAPKAPLLQSNASSKMGPGQAEERRKSAPANLMNSIISSSSSSGVKRPNEASSSSMPNLLELERMNKKKKRMSLQSNPDTK